MADKDDGLSRRELLKRTGVTLGTIALGTGCSDGESDGDAPPTTPTAGQGQGQAGGSGTGTNAAGSGTPNAGRGASGSGGVAGTRPPSGGTSAPAAGSSAGGAGGANEAGAGAGAGQGGSGTAGTTASDRARVAIVKKDTLDESVARAVELAGGIDEIQAGQTVFIKVNAVSSRAIGMTGIRTSNEVIASVIKLVKQRNPGRIIVGDRSARAFDSATVFDSAGIGAAAMAAGADEVYAAPRPDQDPDAWMRAMPPGFEETWGSAGGILVMRKIVEADHLINVPACKNHEFALFSLSMKNFIGAIGDTSRDPIHYLQSGTGNFGPIGRDIALINQAFNPLINIVDATTVIVNGGPYGDGPETVRAMPGYILASRDRVALDALGVSLIKFELGKTTVPQPDPTQNTLKNMSAWSLPQITEGITRKLGVASHDKADLMFDGVADSAGIEAVFRG